MKEEVTMFKILLVDDEITERDGARFLIKKFELPLEIAEAQNGKEALKYIKEHPVDIVFTDIKMPFMDGLELAKATKEYNSNIKVIIFSAYGEFDYAKKALEANVIHYLLKPVEVDEFKKVMTEVINLCEEAKVREKREELLQKNFEKMQEYDREQLLYKLITASEITEQLQRRLEEYQINIINKNIVVLSLCTQKSFYDKNEAFFLKTLEQVMLIKFEYINIDPNTSYLLLYANSKINEEIILKWCTKFKNAILLEFNISLSIIVSNNFNKIEQLPEKIQELNIIKTNVFYNYPDILIAQKAQHFSDSYTEEMDSIKRNIDMSIEHKDIRAIRLNIYELMECIIQSKALSVIYICHLFFDIIKKLYEKFDIYDHKILYDKVDVVLRCSNLKDLEELMNNILDEITSCKIEELFDANMATLKVINIIQNEYREDLCLDYLAAQVYLTPAYLSFIFKQQTGQNLIKYITDFRMSKAKELLEQGSMKIVDISKMCGYPNQSYFNRLFKNYYGLTPKQYREK